MKVAIIEDDPDVLSMLKTSFQLERWEVATLMKDFHEAFFFSFWDGTDVAIVDLMLGAQITGINICAWLRDHRPEVKRIIFSAVAKRTHNGDVSHLADKWIQKPASPLDVVQAAQELCGG